MRRRVLPAILLLFASAGVASLPPPDTQCGVAAVNPDLTARPLPLCGAPGQP